MFILLLFFQNFYKLNELISFIIIFLIILQKDIFEEENY